MMPLRRYDASQFADLSPEDRRMKAIKMDHELSRWKNEIWEFALSAIDDSKRPATREEYYPNMVLGAVEFGEWLFVRSTEDHLVGIVFAEYTVLNREIRLYVWDRMGDLDLSAVCSHLFGDSQAWHPYTPIKLKAIVPPLSAAAQALQRAGFSPTGRSPADTLLRGHLLDTLTLERFHPQFSQPAGQDVEKSPLELELEALEIEEGSANELGINAEHGGTDSRI
jgi:hypothetical protein